MSTSETRATDQRNANMATINEVLARVLRNPDQVSPELIMSMARVGQGLPTPVVEHQKGTLHLPDKDLVLKTFLRPDGSIFTVSKIPKYLIGTSLRRANICGNDQLGNWQDIEPHVGSIRHLQFPGLGEDPAYITNIENLPISHCRWGDWDFCASAVYPVCEIKQVVFWEDKEAGFVYCAMVAKDDYKKDEKPYGVFIFASKTSDLGKTEMIKVIARHSQAQHSIVGIYNNQPLVWGPCSEGFEDLGVYYHGKWSTEDLTPLPLTQPSKVSCYGDTLIFTCDSSHGTQRLISNKGLFVVLHDATSIVCAYSKHLYYINRLADGYSICDVCDRQWSSDAITYMRNGEPIGLQVMQNDNLVITWWNGNPVETTLIMVDSTGEQLGYFSFRSPLVTRVIRNNILIWNEDIGMSLLDEDHFTGGTRTAKPWVPHYGIKPDQMIMRDDQLLAVSDVGLSQLACLAWDTNHLLSLN